MNRLKIKSFSFAILNNYFFPYSNHKTLFNKQFFNNVNICSVFKQGDEGTSWYIILHGSVKVDIVGKVSNYSLDLFIKIRLYLSIIFDAVDAVFCRSKKQEKIRLFICVSWLTMQTCWSLFTISIHDD